MCTSAKGWLIPGSDPKTRKYFLGVPRNWKEGVSAGSNELMKDYQEIQSDQMYGHWTNQTSLGSSPASAPSPSPSTPASSSPRAQGGGRRSKRGRRSSGTQAYTSQSLTIPGSSSSGGVSIPTY